MKTLFEHYKINNDISSLINFISKRLIKFFGFDTNTQGVVFFKPLYKYIYFSI